MPTAAPRRATLYRRRADGTLERKVVVAGTPGAFSGGWSLQKPGVSPAVDPIAQATADAGSLASSLAVKPVDDAILSSRFASLFDPTYAQNEADINKELDLRTSRFGEDSATQAARLAQNRALTEAKMKEQQAAGGASGMLAEQQLGQTLTPYDQQAQDAATQSARFAYDTPEERRKRLLANRQAKASARAGYLADPNNKYEFSF